MRWNAANSDRTPALTPAAETPPELSLLLTIARVELSEPCQDLLRRLVAAPLDWDYLLAMAARHGLEPLLYLHLRRHCAAAIPGPVMESLRANSTAIAARNLILAAKLVGISSHLCSQEVEHAAFKGPLLAETCYGSCALRVFHDLDLIVPAARIIAARDALGEIGFRDKYGLSPAQQSASFHFGFEHPFTAQGGIDLDVHWRLVQKFKSPSLDMEAIWRRVTRSRLFKAEVPALCPEDNLMALCLHTGHHGWIQLSHFCDIAQLLLTYPRLNWEIVRSHLGDALTARIVSVSLYLVHRHWYARIPEDLLATISADAEVPRIAGRVETEIWPSLEPALSTSSLRWLLDRFSGVSPSLRLRMVAGSIVCPAIEDIEYFKLPGIFSSLYPALRPVRLAIKYSFSHEGAVR